jgi:hypothetical protein
MQLLLGLMTGQCVVPFVQGWMWNSGTGDDTFIITKHASLAIKWARRMPLTGAQQTAFFEDATQMGIPNTTVIQLQQEGIDNVDNLVDFDEDTIEQIAANLWCPAGRVPDPNPGAAAGAAVPTPPFFALGAKSQQRLIFAAKLIRLYNTALPAMLLLEIFNGNRSWRISLSSGRLWRTRKWWQTRSAQDNKGLACC